MLVYLIIFGVCAVGAQENSLANVPKSLLECYNDTYLLDRNNKYPQNIPSLLAILRKIEDYPNLNMDLRVLSVALLHRFRQDGIVENPFVPAQAGVTPYAPNGFQFPRNAETLRLIPGNAISFPNNSISSVERCSLHSMLSSSISIMERGDEPTTCRNANSAYRYQRRFSGRRSSGPIDQVETLSPEQLEELKGAESSVDPNSWYPPLPPNHPKSARLFAQPPKSKCPVENGVVKTDWGAVAAGSILAGIAAGLEQQNVKLGTLLREEWQSRDALSSTTLDNKWMATIAGNLAEVALRQGPLAERELTIGVDGHWNSTHLPRWYFLNANEDLFYTAAEIRGDLDGLILGSEIAKWYSDFPELRLSQIIDMYYSDRGVLNRTTRACNRKALLTGIAPNDTITSQAYRSALVLSPGVAKVTIDPATIEKFAVQASEKLFAHIPSMDDPQCAETASSKQFHRISCQLTIFLDTTWIFETVQPVLAALLEGLDVGKYNSNFTVISATSEPKAIINNTDSILDFYHLNESSYSSFYGRFDMPKAFDTMRNLQLRKLDETKDRGLGSGGSDVILFVPRATSISETDKAYCLQLLQQYREQVPDTKLMFLTTGAKNTWSEFVLDPSSDSFSIGVTNTQDVSGPIGQLLSSIEKTPRRLINSQCGSTYSQSGSPSSFDDYLEPSGIQFYKLHPNYFYRPDMEQLATIKIQPAPSTSLSICISRNELHVNSTLDNCVIANGNSHSVAFNCGEAEYIHKCPPFYMSISVDPSPSSTVVKCTDKRFCRFPDMVKYTVSYDNLVCVSAATKPATALLHSPILLLLIFAIYIYSHVR